MRCDELHIAPAQSPAREDGKHEENCAAHSGREEMIGQAGKLEEREEKPSRRKGKHHRIKEAVLLKVSRRHEQKESGSKKAGRKARQGWMRCRPSAHRREERRAEEGNAASVPVL